jgi:hypothetical protein
VVKLRERIGSAVAMLATGRWPGGAVTATKDMPDWPAHLMHWMFQLKAENLDPTEAFLKTASVNAGVRKILRDIGQAKVIVWKGHGKGKAEIERTGKMVDQGGNLADLLHYANPLYTGRQLRQSLVGSRILSGDAYLQLQFFGSRKEPAELWSLPGHLTRPVPGKNRTIEGYEYQTGGQGEWIPIKGGVIIQFSGYNPLDEPVGQSDLRAVAESYLAEWYALRWHKAFFQRGAVIPGVWTTDESWGSRPLTDEMVKAWQETIARRFGSEESRWLPVIVQGIKYAAAGMKLNEMEIETQIQIVEQKIGDALGLPRTAKDGEPDPEADAKYWLGPVKDHVDLLADVMTERLCPYFSKAGDLSIEFSLAHVLPVQNARLEQSKVHYLLAGGVAIESRNEARDAMGMPEMPGEEYETLYEAPIPTPTTDAATATPARSPSRRASPRRHRR